MVDPYASLVMPLTCAGSKAHSFITCGRKGARGACRAGQGCVLGKQARCFPAWLVSEARARNATEQDVAEATALSILEGACFVLVLLCRAAWCKLACKRAASGTLTADNAHTAP
jgi:hypothetical protein